MELVHLAEVDSTSTHAAQLLAAGKRPPFAVFADRQTSGRGRRGSDWTSPSGNLFLTVVLPPPTELAAVQGSMPLKAGVLVARCIQRLSGVRVTLKWPNDLLFAGRKLGGLLLETSTTGGKIGDVVIGIGLNLNVAPSLKDAPYESLSLVDIVPAAGSFEPAAWAAALAATFAADWSMLAAEDVPRAFAEFAIEAGQLWRESSTGTLWQGGELRTDGTLCLDPVDVAPPKAPAAAASSVVLSSADHGHAWIHMHRRSGVAAPLFVADVGNTATKLAVFARAHDQAPSRVVRVPGDAEAGAVKAALMSLRDAVLTADDAAIAHVLHLLSVSPVHAARVTNAARALGMPTLAIPKRVVLRAAHPEAGYDLAALGIDRLAAIEGALAGRGASLSSPRSTGAAAPGTLVVQAGTATTIDALDAAGRHLGGFILPGLRTSLDALHAAAALLPALEPDPAAQGAVLTLGHDTAGAMREGARIAAVGAVEQACRLLRTFLAAEASVEVILTGGYADWLAPSLKGGTSGSVLVAPELVLQGARAMVLGGCLEV